MTRLFTTGYETGDVAEAGTSVIGASMTLTAVNATPTPRGGAYCLKIAPTAATAASTYKSFTPPAAKTDLWVRFVVFIHPVGSVAEWGLCLVTDSAGATQGYLTWEGASSNLRLYRGSSTLIASGSGLAAESWHVIEWRTQITSTTVGVSEVWVDGTRVINFSGDNTNTANANVQEVRVGLIAGLSSVSGGYLAYDDIAINDTAGSVNNGRCGDGRVVLLSPTGAGSSTALTRGGTDTGANWSQTSELPPSMTQYVFSATATTRDLYAMSDASGSIGAINVVEELVLAQNSDAGAGSIGLTLKSGGTTNEATAQALGTSAVYLVSRWEADPNTIAAWTLAAVNALEAGVTVR